MFTETAPLEWLIIASIMHRKSDRTCILVKERPSKRSNLDSTYNKEMFKPLNSLNLSQLPLSAKSLCYSEADDDEITVITQIDRRITTRLNI